MAIKDKNFSLGFLTSPQKILDLYNTLKNNIQTNISLSQVPDFLTLAQKIKNENIKRIVLDNSAQSLLKADFTDEGAYVLLPRTGNYEELQNLARNLFENSEVVLEKARIIVENGTTSPGLARTIGNILKAKNFAIVAMNNAASLNTEKTVVYDISLGEKNITFNALLETLGAQPGVFIPDDVLSKKDSADIVVVLGKDKIPLNAVATQNTTTY